MPRYAVIDKDGKNRMIRPQWSQVPTEFALLTPPALPTTWASLGSQAVLLLKATQAEHDAEVAIARARALRSYANHVRRNAELAEAAAQQL